MYVGPDNLPRRIDQRSARRRGPAAARSTIDYSKWGEEVSIAKPKASEITDKDFFSQLGGPTPEGLSHDLVARSGVL